jgi:hypothetical protein
MTKNNSVKQMVKVLKEIGPMTENEINKAAFGYDRNHHGTIMGESNKKYADMLRRGMRKGLIKRIDADPSSRSQFLYYATRPDSEIWPNRIFSSLEQDMEWANESI